MKRILIKISIIVSILVILGISNIEAYQTCNSALQVTFKNGINLYVDTEEKILDLYK